MLEDLDGASDAQLREEPAHAYICELIALRPPGADPLNKPCPRNSHRPELISLAPPTYEGDDNKRPGDDHPLAGKRHQVTDSVQLVNVEGPHEARDRHVQLVQLDADRGENGEGDPAEDHLLPGSHGAPPPSKMLKSPFSFAPRSDT